MKKNILVLGATSDMAKSFCKESATRGHNIVLAGRDVNNLKALHEDLEIRSSSKIYSAPFDILHTDLHSDFYANLPIKIDLVVCFIGYLEASSSCEKNYNVAKKVFDVNFSCIVSILDIIANDFEKKKDGIIVALSSTAGDRGRASRYHYASAKAALNTYLSGLRNRLFVSNVRVITIKPGYCDTRMIDGMNLPSFLTSDPQDVTNTIFNAINFNKDVIYVYKIWKWIMLIIKIIPEGIFKRLKIN